jgi:hypothetical protein
MWSTVPVYGTCNKVVAEKKQQNYRAGHRHIEKEGLRVESLVKLHNLDGLVEDGIDEEVAGGVPVLEVDGETDGTAGECVGRDEGVGDGGLLLGLHHLGVGDGGEVLDVIVEVHRIPEEIFKINQSQMNKKGPLKLKH